MTEETQVKGVPSPKANEVKERERKVAKVTLPVQGPFLPLPEPDGKRFEIGHFARWNLKKEKEIGELRKKHAELSLGEWISILLGEMCSTLGPHDFKKLNDAERRLVISQLPMPNILYLYFWLRYSSLGPELKIQLECPYHEYKFPWTGDLRTLKIRVPETYEDACWEYELKDPVQIRGKELEKCKCGPAVWNSIEAAGLGRRLNQGKLKSAIIHASVKEINGEPIALADGELDDMTKRDVERLLSDIDRYGAGPDLALNARCDNPKCEREFVTSLDWGYESFFSISSL